MVKKVVYRDQNSNVINIGDWDYIITYQEDDQGLPTEIINNPVPENATNQEEEIYTLDDGGLSVVAQEESN